ncbi:DUF3383 family protein [Pelotomaculum terephthalicicum JT]|uniref:DUF3383 family protein n=1 Tax=Pelotomaculum terephthalicicum TaxID=206393 RepID=UPI001F04EA92|nr:DUF3383 family protein [Pelotomaculum terephthalicicum]MCG9967276.1 DUF3383 family protein [Pelotomaculum terephthalicicum JT]
MIMRLIQSGHKLKSLKTVSCLAILAVLFSLACIVFPGNAGADYGTTSYPASTLEIRTGYSGGTYTTVETFTRSELEAIGTEQHAYSFIDNMPCTVTDSATGVPLADILSECGIDGADVLNFRFWTTDITGGPYETLTKDYLLNTTRYYFPHWADDEDSWNSDGDDIEFPEPTEAASGMVTVPTMIAIHDNWQREFAGSPVTPYYTDGAAGTWTGASGGSTDISGATSPTFKISADGSSATSVTLNPSGLTSGAAIASGMQSAIRALGGGYSDITVSYTDGKYVITSGTTGSNSSIRVTNGDSNDIAATLKLDTANGATYIDGTGPGTDSIRYRLVFGKTNDLGAANPEHTASKSAKWIYRIDVTLEQ